jgi:hypothetical protein
MSIFTYGNFAIFEDKNENFIKKENVEITTEPIIQNFVAKSDNLGRIAFKIVSKKKELLYENLPADNLEDEIEYDQVEDFESNESFLEDSTEEEIYFYRREKKVLNFIQNKGKR